MTQAFLFLSIVIFSFSFLIPPACHGTPVEMKQAYDNKFVGDWTGVLEMGQIKVPLVLRIKQDEKGTITATLDSPNQGVKNIPVDAINFQENSLKFKINNIGMTYEGEFDSKSSEIDGKYEQNGMTIPLVFTPGEAKIHRPQHPTPPFPYDVEEVTYENKDAGITFAGTLTLPRTEGPFPVVRLITGSGAHDRDQTIFGHKPFLVIADYLTKKGIAVLRVDDRGVGKSTGTIETSTTEDFASDVRASVEYLKTRKEINPKKIGLIGHSEGGLIAPLVATQSNDVAFIILMAAPGEKGEKVIYDQGRLLQRVDGVSEEKMEQSSLLQEKMFAILKSEDDQEIAEKKLREVILKYLPELAENQPMLETQVKMANSIWFRFFLKHDPVPVLRQVKVPVLAINGSNDLQVPPKQNLAAISKALEENKDVNIMEIPKLNHLFQTSKTGSMSEYSQIEETVSPIALEAMSNWILERTYEH